MDEHADARQETPAGSRPETPADTTSGPGPTGPTPARTAGLRPESVLVAAGRPARSPGSPVNHGLSLSSTFNAGGAIGYGRTGNEAIQALEEALGALEGGTACVFASGVAATSAVLDGLAAGSLVLIPHSFYNFHETMLADHVRLGRLAVRRVNMTDLQAVAEACVGAAVVWMEVPTNPMLQVIDVGEVSAIARRAGALSVVDATVATPLGHRPLEHGADISMHSATKSISGHSDVLAGVLTTRSPDLAAQFARRRELTGAMPGSLEVFLSLRGLRTLSVRRERAQDNAGELAQRLQKLTRVSAVHYPGLIDHPDSATSAKVLSGAGTLLSFELTGTAAQAEHVCERVELICHATSLGSVESLIERRGRYPGEQAQGTPSTLLRLSVGVEHIEDLWADLHQAIQSV